MPSTPTPLCATCSGRLSELGGNTLGVRQGASVSWLYGDHLVSTSASSGAVTISECYDNGCLNHG